MNISETIGTVAKKAKGSIVPKVMTRQAAVMDPGLWFPASSPERLLIVHHSTEKELLTLHSLHYHKRQDTGRYSIDANSRSSIGRTPHSADTALRFQRYLGIPAQLLIRLDRGKPFADGRADRGGHSGVQATAWGIGDGTGGNHDPVVLDHEIVVLAAEKGSANFRQTGWQGVHASFPVVEYVKGHWPPAG